MITISIMGFIRQVLPVSASLFLMISNASDKDHVATSNRPGRTILTRTQDDVLPVPARVLCDLFHHDLKKSGAAPLLAGIRGKRHGDRAGRGSFPAGRYPVLVSC